MVEVAVPGAAEIIRSIDAELEVAMGRPAQVGMHCARLRSALGAAPSGPPPPGLVGLARRLRERDGAIAEPVFALLADTARTCDDPAPLLSELFLARDPAFVRRAVGIAVECARAGSLPIDDALLASFAARVDAEGCPWREPEILAALSEILSLRPGAARPEAAPAGTAQDSALVLYLGSGPPSVRRLAARILDLPGEPVPPPIAARLLGEEAGAFLAPLLHYTRAGYDDILCLVPEGAGDAPPPILASLRRAVATCGEALAREIVGTLGWPRVSAGLECTRFAGVSVSGSIPLMVHAGEAPLFEALEGARRAGESILVVAHGGRPSTAAGPAGDGGPAARFRALNLTHATLLADLMDAAPLDHDRTGRILAGMERAVDGFASLFAAQADECAVLTGVYRDLRARVLALLAAEGAAPQLSAELTRLVLAFEDPHTPGEVRSLHGLKRYLHQRGLRLGFRLVEGGRGTNRTVDLLLCESGRIGHRVTGIEYVDFEPFPEAIPGRRADPARIPYPVAVVVDGFARQLLYGHTSFPHVRVFCYGNEVHYYLGYGTHPAFLRIDHSPPLLGGMIDLEFYGVSKYEMAQHPDPGLDALRLFFRRLEFDCSVEATRVHARYDKERALDTGDLHEKTLELFRLAPYFMDLDWIVGGLALDAEARKKVAASWAGIFALWGALPLSLLLTRDRRGILASIADGPAGRQEVAWTGEGPYQDRFTPLPPASAFAPLRPALQALGFDLPPEIEIDATPAGSIAIERVLLRPLRDAVARGAIDLTAGGPRAAAPVRFAREHECDWFARMLAAADRTAAAPGAPLADAARMAPLARALERGLRFETTGSVNGREVQRAPLLVRGERLSLYVLRDAAGIVRLAFCAPGDVIGRQRSGPVSPWTASACLDASSLAALLRAGGALVAGPAAPAAGPPEDTEEIRARLLGTGPIGPRPAAPGERRAPGLRASPGRAVGPARFGTTGRRPEDLDGAVLLAPSVRPDDGAFLYRCAGIVSTGGGILSHAGLIATEFRKPALIVPGEWRAGPDGRTLLAYRTAVYRQEDRLVEGLSVSVRRDAHEREERLREGDLVVVDADAGMMRVLGQGRDALALHEGLRGLADLGGRLGRATDEAAILALRGRRLRTRFLLERVLARLADPALACHAVEELLLGLAEGREPGRAQENSGLLATLVANPAVGPVARDALAAAVAEIRRRARASVETGARVLPTSVSLEEIHATCEDVGRRCGAVRAVAAALPELDVADPALEEAAAGVRAAARRRLETLRDGWAREIRAAADGPSPPPRLRHAVRRLERIERALGGAGDGTAAAARARLDRHDEARLQALRDRDVLDASECGAGTHALVGWKAANLAEVTRLAGTTLVPPWFVITDRAFRRVLDRPVESRERASTLREAIARVLDLAGLDSAGKAARIREIWERVTLPGDLAAAIAGAHARLERAAAADDAAPGATAPSGDGFVAVRSSALEEDTESAARAGEFDTFLFVRGAGAVLDHVRRAWCGLWSERALHHRAILPPGGAPGGGVIVQRMVRARAAGVVQTINVAAGDFREMVVNAGLGLGEGIVSGRVAADHIVIARTGTPVREPLRFRYVTADKREQVVYDERTGIGTVRVESRYHQRLRPALEYIEMLELARIAAALEESFALPLDIEFAVEDARLWILQARPVAGPLTFLSDSTETRP